MPFRLVLGGLLLAGVTACQGARPTDAESHGIVRAVDPAEALGARLAGLDVLHIELFGDGQRAARIEATIPSEGVEALQETTATAAYELAGHPVRLSFLHAQVDPAVVRRLTVTLTWQGALPSAADASVSGEALLNLLDPGDRATLRIHDVASLRGMDLGLAPLVLHARTLRELAQAAASEELAAIPAGAPFAPGADNAGPSLAAVQGFLAFCESELLVRRPTLLQFRSAAPADAWFGDLVAIDPGPEGAALRGLPGLMFQLYLGALPSDEARAEAAGLHALSVEDEWSVPRFLALREMMGEDAFRGLLRQFVDTHRGGDSAVGWEAFAEASEVAAPDLGARFVRAWLRNDSEPRVKTRWSYDEARGRVLLRVDQVHELRGGRNAPAFPFLLPVRVTDAEGKTLDRVLEVDKRRDLLEIEVPGQPVRFEVDPEDTLAPLLSLEASDTDDPGGA
ncbi:MAG: hypothetical protein ACI80K_001927 [Paracoccaceae bacterium]